MGKPATQTLSVAGMKPNPVNTPDHINIWPIAGHPPFQMFLHEKLGPPSDAEIDDCQRAFDLLMSNPSDRDSLLQEYEAWHAAKGYWPNETPLGEPNPDPVSIAQAVPKDSEVA